MATASKNATKTADNRQAPQQQAPQQAPAGNLPASQQPKKENALVAFKAHLDERMGELSFALPSHISPERFQRIALTALQRKPDLLKCTKQSLWNACLLAAQDGLMPDGREGAIVPYGENAQGKKQADIATWMPMIEGLRKKARNSGEIANWEVHAVRARDVFDHELGDNAFILHKPYFGPEEPGEVIGAYSIATLRDGTKSRDVMSIRDILKIKAKSKASNGPWSDPTFFPEMCKKTVARRHYKQLPHSSDLDDMMQRDDQAFGLDDRSEDQIEQRQNRRLGSTAATFDQFAGSGSSAFIEHQQEDDQQPGSDEEAAAAFADDDQGTDQQQAEQPKEDPKPDAGKKEDPASSGPQGGQQQPDNAAKPQPDAKGAAATNPANDTPGSAPEQSANDDRRWPNGAVPSDPDEYEHYAETKIGDFTEGPAVSAWWKSKEETDLRKACNVSKALFDALQAKAQARYSELLRAAKAK